MTADVLASATHSASSLPSTTSSTNSSMPPLDSDQTALVSSTDALSLTSPDAGLPKAQDNGSLDTSCEVEHPKDESHDDEKKSVDEEDEGVIAPGESSATDSTALPPPPSAPPPTHVTVHQVSLQDARGLPGVYSGPLCVSTDLPDGHDGCMAYPDCPNDNDNNDTAAVLKYTGDWVQGHWEGTGTSFAASGETFTGTFVQSQRVQGRMISADGRRVYEGHYNAKGQRDGTGTMTYYETAMEPEASHDQQPVVAAVYAGDWRENQRHGHGTYHDLRQGIQYEGDFQLGLYHGQGVYQWKDGKEVYTGSFCRGQPHGKGVHKSRVEHENGTSTTVTRHAGLWSQGQPVQEQAPSTATSRAIVVERQAYTDKLNYPNSSGLRGIYRGLWNATAQHPQGHGTMEYQHDANSSQQNATTTPVVVSYEGCWKKGRYHGHGRLVWSQGDAYEGPFVAGQRHTGSSSSSSSTETGTYGWADGRVYTGGFQHNVRTGQGLLVYPNQDYYQGAFLSGLRHGPGRFVFCDGSCYEGAWSEGHYHGKGRLTQSDGTVLEGTFANGNLHGHGVEYSPDGLPIYEGDWIDGERLDHYQEAAAAAAAAQQQEQDEEEQRQLQKARRETTEPLQETVAAAVPPAASSVVDETATQPHTWVAPPLQDDDVPRVASSTSRRTKATATTNRDHDDEEPCHAVVDQAILDAQNNPGKYTGLVSTRTLKPHGVGRLVYADGKRIHEGFWIQGSKEGRGRCLFYPQGDFFDGEFQGNLRNGPGKYQWKNGRLYVGNYKNDLRHGHGVFTYPTGERYEGEFRQGRRWGFGRFDFQNDEDEDDDEDREQGYYEGDWKAGQYHGKGKLVLASESVMFEGTFAQGSLHGHGVKRNAVTGEVLEEGIFVHGVLQEEGTAGVAVEQPETN